MRAKILLGGIVAVVLIVVTLAAGKSYFFDERNAEKELREYIAKMYADKIVLGQDCVGRDTDGDGYVSCSARVRGRDEKALEETLSLECASDFTNSGCKTRTGVIKMTP